MLPSRSGIRNDRIQYIDIARFYAMAMVFYGHFIERIMLLNDPAAAMLYKFIYSFHMVLFFVLSGFIAGEKDLASGAWKYFKRRFFSRLLPFIFFTLVFMGLAAVFPGDFFNLKLPSIEGYVNGLVMTGLGVPLFCIPSWFLLMLFSVEMIHFFAYRVLKSDTRVSKSDLKIMIAIPAFYKPSQKEDLGPQYPSKGKMMNGHMPEESSRRHKAARLISSITAFRNGAHRDRFKL